MARDTEAMPGSEVKFAELRNLVLAAIGPRSYTSVARQLGVTTSTISQLAAGQIRLQRRQLMQLARVLGVDSGPLFVAAGYAVDGPAEDLTDLLSARVPLVRLFQSELNEIRRLRLAGLPGEAKGAAGLLMRQARLVLNGRPRDKEGAFYWADLLSEHVASSGDAQAPGTVFSAMREDLTEIESIAFEYDRADLLSLVRYRQGDAHKRDGALDVAIACYQASIESAPSLFLRTRATAALLSTLAQRRRPGDRGEFRRAALRAGKLLARLPETLILSMPPESEGAKERTDLVGAGLWLLTDLGLALALMDEQEAAEQALFEATSRYESLRKHGFIYKMLGVAVDRARLVSAYTGHDGGMSSDLVRFAENVRHEAVESNYQRIIVETEQILKALSSGKPRSAA
jgi:transcriptional regulator with XRE-family HTH domain